jgi:cystathionine beta-lyase/cystathionine gamma-synthase
MEVCSNPLLRLIDLNKVVEIVKGYNKDILIAIDNTFLTPYIVVIVAICTIGVLLVPYTQGVEFDP